MAQKEEEPFLEKLTRAFAGLEAQSTVNTRDFTDAIEKLFPVFDHLGMMLIDVPLLFGLELKQPGEFLFLSFIRCRYYKSRLRAVHSLVFPT